ncbi:MAG: hypothetical protein CENE_01796 [Candidatus Celerinatantimonas neptuna]|nr:MAG: hypothetical protein CENE_01796 [Candidatus Celerinatantimonas neptuna]
MLGDNHTLVQEFPEYAYLITILKKQDEIFASHVDQYHRLDHQIRGLEKNHQPTTDERMNQLKTQRARLKDQIYQILIAQSS